MKQMLTILLGFAGSLATKFVFLTNCVSLKQHGFIQ